MIGMVTAAINTSIQKERVIYTFKGAPHLGSVPHGLLRQKQDGEWHHHQHHVVSWEKGENGSCYYSLAFCSSELNRTKKQLWKNAPIWTMLNLNPSALPRLTASELHCSSVQLHSAVFGQAWRCSPLRPAFLLRDTKGQAAWTLAESIVLVAGRLSEEGMEQNGTLMVYVHLSLSPRSMVPKPVAPSDDFRIQNSNLAVPTQC